MSNLLTYGETKKMEALFRSYPQVVVVYLFGSRAKNKNFPNSDLDIGVLCLNKSGISPVDMAYKVQSYFPRYNLDIVVLDINNDPLILTQVINGKLLYQSNLAVRISLETRILQLYEDSQFLRKISNYYLDKSFREGIYAH